MPDYGDAQLQFYYDNQWNDAPLADPNRGGVTIVRGRGPEQDQPSPSSLSAPVDNYSGDYNPRNPSSDLFGKIGRNTPTRLYLGTPNLLGDTNFSLSSTTSHVAPSVTAPAAGQLICAWAAPDTSASYTLPGGMTAGLGGDSDLTTTNGGRESVSSGATGTRTATLSASRDYVSASVYVKGPTSVTTGSLVTAGNSFTLDVDAAGDLWVLFTTFASANNEDPPFAPAYPSDTDGGGWLLLADTGNQQVNANGVEYMRMKAWVKTCRTVNESHTISLPGADADTTISFVTRVPADDVSGDWDIRGCGEAASWEPNRSGNFVPDTKGDSWTGLSAKGVLRRLGQGAQPVLSALRRYIATTDPAAYWPMEDDSDSAQFASGLLGGSALTITQKGGIDLATDDSLPGSAPLPMTVRNTGYGQQMILDGQLPALDGWTVGFWSRLPDLSSEGDEEAINTVTVLTVGGDMWSIFHQYAPVNGDEDNFAVSYTLGDGTSGVALGGNIITKTHTNDWVHIRVTVVDSSGDASVQMWVNDVSIGSSTETDVDVDTTARIQSAISTNVSERVPASFGHLTVWSGTVAPADMADAGAGFAGETAGDRFLRLCAESGVAGSVLGDPDDTMTMGAQPPDTFTNLLDEIERTDAGILYEPRDQLAVVYRTRSSLYNQDTKLELDWDSGKMAPLVPSLDDRYTRNDVTASRRSGSFARAVQESGPLNVQDPTDDADGVGRYVTQVDVNPEADATLPDLAGWYLRLGTVDETRFPIVTVDLDLYTAVAGDAAAVDIGDRITITNAPADLSPGTIDLIVVGYTERITPTRRLIDFNCIPTAGYTVAEADGDPRVDTDGSELAASLTSSATSFTVSPTSPNTGLWTTDSADFPLDVNVGGEVIRLSGISGTTSPQTFTVDTDGRAVNGVTKSHAAGTPVNVAEPAYVPL